MNAAVILFVVALPIVLLTGCNDEPPPPQTLTQIAVHIETPANTFTAPLSSPLTVATSTTFESPLAGIGSTTQYTVPDAYTGAYHYRIAYASAEWRVEVVEEVEGFYSPRLEHLAIEGCRMRLRDGAQGLSPDTIIVEKTLAGLTWGAYTGGRRYVFYILSQPDKGIAFILRLEMPEEAADEVRVACQAAAEAVIDTFTLVPPPTPIHATAPVICVPDESSYRCDDTFLGIHFEYPMAWGALSAQFYEAGLDGNYYNYDFSQSTLRAGGRGKIISPRGRGRMWTDFSGYQPEQLQATCQTHSAAYCKEIKPGVLIMLQKADSASICQESTMGVPGFLAFVAVNLPDHEQITGMIFPMMLYPSEIQTELDGLLSRANPSTDCQRATRRAMYDQRISELFEALEVRSTTATDAWYQPIFQFAEAIVIDP